MKQECSGANLVEILQHRAAHQGAKVAYTFLADGERESESMTFCELDTRAHLVAANLQQRAMPGERALLVYPSGLEYIVAFVGCLYAGIIAVPVYPPTASSHLGRLLSVAKDSQATLLLTTHDLSQRFQAAHLSWEKPSALQLMETDKLIPENSHSPGSRQRSEIAGGTVAFLQYTSGSTAAPKGVMVSHDNLMHNLRLMKEALGHTDETVFVSWLPIYHDMGLIGNILSTTYNGARCILMSPADFIQQPPRWLEALSRYRGTCTLAPNFAYELCVKKVSAMQLAKLDLSSWAVAVNGAEPVRADTVRRFAETFEPCGLPKNALRPGYGLAEGTLFVSTFVQDEAAMIRSFDAASLAQDRVVEVLESQHHSRVLVSCGKGCSDQQIEIVNPDTRIACPPGHIGEIWVKGPSVAQGYWNKPELTQPIFQACVADSGSSPFLRTGDLGFLYQGELFITGRHKDLVIINGRNHYPQDIELTAEQSHPALRPGCGAAFSVNAEEGERIVIVYEIGRSYMQDLDSEAVAHGIRRAVAEQHEIEIHTVVFVKAGTIPKTSSGKIQRSLCRAKFISGGLETIREASSAVPPAAGMETATVVPDVGHPPMEFSLFYFSSNEGEFQRHKYRLLLEGAKFADEHDFTAVWVPERHFHAFGGLYPNPSVLASALSVATKRVRIRAGSVVLPLHNPVRVAEEWSVVDNLSDGRVDLAFARGWNPNDFTLAPANYPQSLNVLYQSMEVVRALWRGASIRVPNGKGDETEIKIYPLPRQPELQLWLTCSGGVERFVEAGAAGLNVLTALLFQSVEELGQKIAAYRQARVAAGHAPGSGHVTLMMHTFLGTDPDEVKNKVRGPFIEYLRSSVDLWRHGWQNLEDLNPKQRDEALSFAFERYYRTSGLFGTPETCLETVRQLKQVGVNEIACLIDFGVATDDVLNGLHALHWLQERTRTLNEPGKRAQSAAAAAAGRNGPAGMAPHREPEQVVSAHRPSQREHAVSQQSDFSSPDWLLTSLVKQAITNIIIRVTQRLPEAVPSNEHFLTLGINSLKGAEILHGIQKRFELSLAHSVLFEFPTVERLAEMLVREYHDRLAALMLGRANQNDVQPQKAPEPSLVPEGGRPA
jgi:natural product biosynthesis luciferase-like monooxygenase protein